MIVARGNQGKIRTRQDCESSNGSDGGIATPSRAHERGRGCQLRSKRVQSAEDTEADRSYDHADHNRRGDRSKPRDVRAVNVNNAELRQFRFVGTHVY